MIKKLRLHNFRTYLNAEIEFGRRHLIIGKNNSGKTNLCYALRFLGRTTFHPLVEAANTAVAGGVSELKHFKFASNTIDFALTCELPFADEQLTYNYDLSLEVTKVPSGSAPTEGLRVLSEKLSVSGGHLSDVCLLENDGHEARLLDEEQVGRKGKPPHEVLTAPENATMLSTLYELETNRRAVLFRRFLRQWTYYLLEPESIRWGWREAVRTGFVYADGKHVADAVFHLKNQDERRYRRLIERAKVVEEALEAINFLVSPDQGVVPFVALRSRDRASWAGLSDGTLRALTLSHLIEAADAASSVEGWPPTMTVVEEPENGIYVGLLRHLLEEFESCAPRAQFIFTSHSPYVVDLFDRDLQNVTCLRREGGVTTSRPLSDLRETIDRNRNEYDLSLGEQHYKELFE